jgi:hypothetical protein
MVGIIIVSVIIIGVFLYNCKNCHKYKPSDMNNTGFN